MKPEVRKIKIKRMRRNNPCNTLVQIGSRYGVTRERVRQILKEAGLPTKAEGNLCYNYPNQRFCLNCGKVRLYSTQPKFCSAKCRTEYTTIDVVCLQCGMLFQLYQSQVILRLRRYKNLFCSHLCSVKYYHLKRGHKVEIEK